MAYPKWRNYGFFDKELVKSPEDDQVVDVLKDINITVSSSGRGHMVFGDILLRAGKGIFSMT
jgi:hypothetical protein